MLLLLLLHWRGWRGRWDHNFSLDEPGWVINKAVGVPVGVTVKLHALKGAYQSWGGFLYHTWWGRGWRWGRPLWWRWRMRHCYRGWSSLLGAAVRVVAGVTEHRHGTAGQVDNVGLTERVPAVAQVKDVSLRNGWSKRGRRWRCRGLCRPWDPPFHWRWRSDFTPLVCSWVTHDHGNSQFALEIGCVGAVGVLQVPHLLVEHPQLVDLIDLRGGASREQ